jgi:hypothetical protein
MDQLASALKNLPEEEAPSALRNKIRHRVFVLKYRNLIYLLSSLLTVNFILLADWLRQYITDSGALSVIRVMINGFELSTDYLANFFLGLKEILPPLQVWALAANLILIIGLITVFRRYHHELLKI